MTEAPFTENRARHLGMVEHESLRHYQHRAYILAALDDSHFDALNPGGRVLGLNGYCLDAVDYVPAGSMYVCAELPTQRTAERGTTAAQVAARKALAKRLIAEMLAEQAKG